MDNALIALLVFAAVYVVIVLNLADKTVAVLFGALTMVGLGILSEVRAIESVHWEAIGLIFGMFVLVAALSDSGFFRWIGLHALKITRFSFYKIFIVFCVLSAFLAAFMDSITVMIFMASLTVEVCVILKAPVMPILIAEICSANIGGSSTMVGDPPNVIIGTALDLSFMDFVMNTGPIAVVAFVVNLLIFGFLYRHIFKKRKEKNDEEIKKIIEEHKDLDPFSAITDLRQMRIALIVFAFTVTLLIMHSVLDLLVAYVAILGATLVLIIGGRKLDHLIDKIDWHTIVFLAGLFVMVGGLEESGLLASFANYLAGLSGGNLILLSTILLWTAAILSAIFDNVPLSAAMIPIIETLSAKTGAPLDSLGYTLAMGSDIGGNATPIGASANVVGLAVAEKNGVKHTWREYCRTAVPAMIITMLVINVLVILILL